MEKTVKFEFTIDQTNMILEALIRMPYGQVAALVTEVQKTAQEQLGDGTRTVPPPAK
jgi:hypothetical protein